MRQGQKQKDPTEFQDMNGQRKDVVYTKWYFVWLGRGIKSGHLLEMQLEKMLLDKIYDATGKISNVLSYVQSLDITEEDKSIHECKVGVQIKKRYEGKWIKEVPTDQGEEE